MKRTLGVAVLAFIVGACADAPTSPRALLGTRVSLAASTTTTSERIDNSYKSFVPCANGGAGETVQVSGVLHVTEHLSTSTSGHRVLHMTFNPQGITGVGLVSGDTYHSAGVTQVVVRYRGGQPFSNTFTNNFLLIGPGPNNNLQVNELIHVTETPHLEVTARVIKIDILCR